MKRLADALGSFVLLCGLAAGAARADEQIAGTRLFAVSHGQPICRTRAELQALLNAQVAEAPISLFAFPGCHLADDNTVVAAGEDFAGGRYMHMVRVRYNLFFAAVDGYTFSVGLYPLPVRSTPAHLNPFF